MTNSVDPDQKSHSAVFDLGLTVQTCLSEYLGYINQSDQGLHCLPFSHYCLDHAMHCLLLIQHSLDRLKGCQMGLFQFLDRLGG